MGTTCRELWRFDGPAVEIRWSVLVAAAFPRLVVFHHSMWRRDADDEQRCSYFRYFLYFPLFQSPVGLWTDSASDARFLQHSNIDRFLFSGADEKLNSARCHSSIVSSSLFWEFQRLFVFMHKAKCCQMISEFFYAECMHRHSPVWCLLRRTSSIVGDGSGSRSRCWTGSVYHHQSPGSTTFALPLSLRSAVIPIWTQKEKSISLFHQKE